VPAAVGDYLARWVHGPATLDDYLDLFGGERLKRAQDAAHELVWEGASTTPSQASPRTDCAGGADARHA
jgi:hypothetical protein